MYEDYDSVILKDGRYAIIEDTSTANGKNQYALSVGCCPKDWELVYLTDKDIARKATDREDIEHLILSMEGQGFVKQGELKPTMTFEEIKAYVERVENET